ARRRLHPERVHPARRRAGHRLGLPPARAAPDRPMSRPYEADGCETVEYHNPAGEVVTFRMLVGALARGMPPVKNTTIALPARSGSRLLGSAHLERAVAIPVVAPGTLTDRAELRRWAHVLDPVKGEGTLTVVAGPSPGRYLRCVYDAGLDELAETGADINL